MGASFVPPWPAISQLRASDKVGPPNRSGGPRANTHTHTHTHTHARNHGLSWSCLSRMRLVLPRPVFRPGRLALALSAGPSLLVPRSPALALSLHARRDKTKLSADRSIQGQSFSHRHGLNY